MVLERQDPKPKADRGRALEEGRKMTWAVDRELGVRSELGKGRGNARISGEQLKGELACLWGAGAGVQHIYTEEEGSTCTGMEQKEAGRRQAGAVLGMMPAPQPQRHFAASPGLPSSCCCPPHPSPACSPGVGSPTLPRHFSPCSSPSSLVTS